MNYLMHSSMTAVLALGLLIGPAGTGCSKAATESPVDAAQEVPSVGTPIAPTREVAAGPGREEETGEAKDPQYMGTLSPEVESLFNLGVEALQAAEPDFELAERNFRRALEINPYVVAARYNLGVVCQRTGREEDAIREYRRALLINPKLEAALVNLGIILYEHGENEEAVKMLERAIAVNLENAMAHLYLGMVLLEQRRGNAAVEHFGLAVEIDPTLSRGHLELGRIYLASGKGNEGKMALLQAFRSGTLDGPCLVDMGNLCLGANFLELAVNSYEKAIELGSGSAAIYNNLGVIYRRQGEYAKARESFNRAIETSQNLTSVFNNLGVLDILEERYEAALTNYEKALKINPDLTGTLFNIGLLYHLYLDDPRQAALYYRRYLDAGGEEADQVREWLWAIEESLIEQELTSDELEQEEVFPPGEQSPHGEQSPPVEEAPEEKIPPPDTQ